MRENRTVPFRDTSIKVSRNYYGHQYICMADVCEITKQREILKDGAILNLCPSALKMTFRRNGREYWAIRPSDMHTIIQLVRRLPSPIPGPIPAIRARPAPMAQPASAIPFAKTV